MKRKDLILGFLLGIGTMFLTSAITPQTESTAPNYHITMIGTQAFVYNSTTGEMKHFPANYLKKFDSLKTLLEKE